MGSSQIAVRGRTFRSGPYLDELFRQAERMDEQRQIGICVRIKQARVEAGFTQEEAAELLGLTGRGYQHYEKSRVPFRKLGKLAELFNVTEPWFLYGEEARRSGSDDETLTAILLRLEGLEAKVDGLPTAPQLKRGLDTLRKAIDAQANRGTRRAAGTG